MQATSCTDHNHHVYDVSPAHIAGTIALLLSILAVWASTMIPYKWIMVYYFKSHIYKMYSCFLVAIF